HAGEPFVAEVLPVPARAHGLEDDLVDPLHHLVTELDRRVETQRRALFARHRGAIAAVGEDGLRMLRTLAIPARVIANRRRIRVRVAPLEAAEFDEPGARVGAAKPGDLRDTHALPRRHGGPAFDAMVPDAELRGGQAA